LKVNIFSRINDRKPKSKAEGDALHFFTFEIAANSKRQRLVNV
jgi:hypothetical protein